MKLINKSEMGTLLLWLKLLIKLESEFINSDF